MNSFANHPSQFLLDYFRAKNAQMLALAQQVISPHPSLKGRHREELVKLYLQDFLPERFKVGEAMIYDAVGQHTSETDVVIWDSHNYPSLKMLGHSLYFHESVKLVVEVKSSYSTENMNDVCRKCKQLRGLAHLPHKTILDAIIDLQTRVDAITTDRPFSYIEICPRPSSAAIFLTGGAMFSLSNLPFIDNGRIDVDTDWPDIMLLLEEGILVIKGYDIEVKTTLPKSKLLKDVAQSFGKGILKLYHLDQDALLVFTVQLLHILNSYSTFVEDVDYFHKYVEFVIGPLTPNSIREFELRSPPPGRYKDYFVQE